MDAYSENNFSGKALDHLGLVADKIDDLKIIPFTEKLIPVSEILIKDFCLSQMTKHLSPLSEKKANSKA
jgi:hypothetical protein